MKKTDFKIKISLLNVNRFILLRQIEKKILISLISETIFKNRLNTAKYITQTTKNLKLKWFISLQIIVSN
jgi:hypothetical protein